MKTKPLPALAMKLRDLGAPNWQKGSALYFISPPVEYNDMGFITETSYVIVGYTKVSKTPIPDFDLAEALDGWTGPLDGTISSFTDGPPETTCFAANDKGKLLGDDYENDEFPNCRVTGGPPKPEKALAKLQGGYRITTNKTEVDESVRLFRERMGRWPLDHPIQKKIEEAAIVD
jgi:hypothetical protein